MAECCAKPECDKDAMSDQPRLCAEHTLQFFAILGGITRDRLEREANDTTTVAEEEER